MGIWTLLQYFVKEFWDFVIGEPCSRWDLTETSWFPVRMKQINSYVIRPNPNNVLFSIFLRCTNFGLQFYSKFRTTYKLVQPTYYIKDLQKWYSVVLKFVSTSLVHIQFYFVQKDIRCISVLFFHWKKFSNATKKCYIVHRLDVIKYKYLYIFFSKP